MMIQRNDRLVTALCQQHYSATRLYFIIIPVKKLNIQFINKRLILCYHIITKKIIRMAEQATTSPALPTKKQVRKEIGEKLSGALAEYKEELGEKKLATHVKEVSKLISRDLLKISKKQQERKKKAAPKKAAKGKSKK
jgi:hypothetical protein